MTESKRTLMPVLRELVARRATGVLAVRLPELTGEVRFRTGVIEDVVLGRAEGAKALARMLAAVDLGFAFRDASEGWLRRIDEDSDELLARAAAAQEALSALLEPFRIRRESFAIGLELSAANGARLSAGARALWSRLRTPAAFADIFDLVADDDIVTARALAELESVGALRWLELESERQPLGASHWDGARVRERLGETVRIVVAGTAHRVAVFAHTLLHVDDVIRPTGDEPLVPMPHVVATIALDGASVDVLGCPLVPAYSPLWPLSLSASSLVVRLDHAAPELLEAAAALVGVEVIQAEALVGPFDEGRVGAVAGLMRAALDHAAGDPRIE